jgi:hypothetical protein
VPARSATSEFAKFFTRPLPLEERTHVSVLLPAIGDTSRPLPPAGPRGEILTTPLSDLSDREVYGAFLLLKASNKALDPLDGPLVYVRLSVFVIHHVSRPHFPDNSD